MKEKNNSEKDFWVESLKKRRNLTFSSDKDIYKMIPPFPREITLDINNRCNHKCYFCANPKIEKYHSLETDLAYDLMRQGLENGCTDLALQATGEPFMDKRLAKFVQEAKRLGYEYVYINTNGALANPERTKPVIDAGCDSIKFSINANSREDFKNVHGYDDFDKVIKNLKWIYEYRNSNEIKMGIYVSSVKSSKISITENIENLIKPYCDNFDFRDVSNQGGSMMELNQTESIKKGNILGSLKTKEFTSRCIYPFNRIVIDPYGYVVACSADFHNQLGIGDTRKESLKDIWKSKIFTYLRKKHLDNEYSGLYCNKCLNNVDCKTTKLTQAYEEKL
jgi:radical SAM protein with 4Fe4S-binding SPASM domain